MDDRAAYYQAPPPPPPSGLQPPHYPYYQPPPLAAVPPASAPSAGAQPPQYYPIPPPPFAAAYVPPPPPTSMPAFLSDVRTLFVAGLPEDVKPREIYNLFREFPGYESSHLRSPSETSQPFAFVVFTDQQSALSALHALNGMVFDLEKGSTLSIDLAKANSRSKRSRTRDNERSGLDKKIRGSGAFSSASPDSGFGSVHMPGMVNSAYNTIGSTQSYDGLPVGETTVKSNKVSASHVSRNTMPCPTLFVANLGPNCTEQELNQVFSRCPGFLKLKMQGTFGSPVAFVDFQDTTCSTGALNHLQGTVLYSSPGEGMRLEYAKSRMGMRKKPK